MKLERRIREVDRILRICALVSTCGVLFGVFLWGHFLIADGERRREGLEKLLADQRSRVLDGTATLKEITDFTRSYTLLTSGIDLRVNEHHHHRGITGGLQQSYLVDDLDHICIEANFASRTLVIMLPSDKPETHWLHAFPTPARNTLDRRKGIIIYRGYGEYFVEQRIVLPDQDLAYAGMALWWIVREQEGYALRECEQIETLARWKTSRQWFSVITSFTCFLIPMLAFSLGGLHPSLRTIAYRMAREYGLERAFAHELAEKHRIDWLNGQHEPHLLNALRLACAKQQKREANKLKRERLRALVGEEQAKKIETRYQKKNKPQLRRERRSTSGRIVTDSFDGETEESEEGLTTEVRQLLKENIFEDSEDGEVVDPSPDPDEPPHRKRWIRAIQACSHELELSRDCSDKQLQLLAENLRSMKRAITREEWARFVEELDTEDEATWKPPITLTQQGDIQGLQRYFNESEQRYREAKQGTPVPPLLSGKSVLIVGGLKRLAGVYIEQAQSLGASSVQYRHHSELRRLNQVQCDVILYLHRHSSHSAHDKIRSMPGRVIMVRHHQRSSFLRGLVASLEEQL